MNDRKEATGPVLVKELIPDVLALSRQRHEQRIAHLQALGIDLEGSARSMLSIVAEVRNSSTRLATLIPEELRVRELLRATIEEDVIDAERRLHECEICPQRGGMCARSAREGMQPSWGADADGIDSILWSSCDRWRTYAIDQHMISCGFPVKLVRKCELYNFRADTPQLEEVLTNVKRWTFNYRTSKMVGKGLLLLGSRGIGKTHLAIGACRWLIEEKLVRSPRFWEFAHLVSVLRKHNDASEVAITQAMYCPLLVLDDLNTDRITQWVQEQLGMIINHRWSNGLITIVTSNDDLQAYANTLGDRTVSRIQDMTGSLNWQGQDWRLSDHE